MIQPFDNTASYYDSEFTNTTTGRMQRERVHWHLSKLFQQNTIKDVLELNCGTGEDAVWLARQGCQVLATDISSEMVSVAQQKATHFKLENSISCQTLDAGTIGELGVDKKYDLIFSNFGGLNCLSPQQLEKLAKSAAKLLKPKGFFVAVVMPRFCWWETLFFTLKREFKKAWRRRSKEPISARLSDTASIDTWYYATKEFYRYFQADFRYKQVNAIGLFLPPSYLDKWFENKPFLINNLNRIEKWVPRGTFFANAADHFMIQMQQSDK
ncbi:MAG: class I SAM-dependent methyltransferase [Aureispira sp.]|nr:class I SAM-dependent methyltransferase [Aureispira sp.]